MDNQQLEKEIKITLRKNKVSKSTLLIIGYKKYSNIEIF